MWRMVLAPTLPRHLPGIGASSLPSHTNHEDTSSPNVEALIPSAPHSCLA